MENRTVGLKDLVEPDGEAQKIFDAKNAMHNAAQSCALRRAETLHLGYKELIHIGSSCGVPLFRKLFRGLFSFCGFGLLVG